MSDLAGELKPQPRSTWPASLRALRHPEFRALWIAFLISSIGTWMQIVAQSLLVLRLAHGSAFALGCVSLSQASAFFLFALIGGGFADGLDRRRLLMVSQTALMLLAAVLGFLTIAGRATVLIVALIAFLSGVILSFDQPARAALVSTLVPQKDLLNAISLQSAVFNGASIAGPALAGLVVNWLGLAADFFLNALSFIAVLAALLFLAVRPSQPRRRGKLISQIREALRSVHGNPALLAALSTYGILLFAGPSLQLLLPVLALNRLHVGPATLGCLFSASGVGAVIGAIVLAGYPIATLRFIWTALACWCAALALAGTSPIVPITFCALVILGASQNVVAATTSTFLQTGVPAQQRGRVMSLNTLLLMGVRPLGDFPAGALIAAVGAPFAALTSAAIVAAGGVLIYGKERRSVSQLTPD